MEKDGKRELAPVLPRAAPPFPPLPAPPRVAARFPGSWPAAWRHPQARGGGCYVAREGLRGETGSIGLEMSIPPSSLARPLAVHPAGGSVSSSSKGDLLRWHGSNDTPKCIDGIFGTLGPPMSSRGAHGILVHSGYFSPRAVARCPQTEKTRVVSQSFWAGCT